MKTLRKTVAVIMTVLMVFSAMSAGFVVGVTAAYGCNHDIGEEGCTLEEYSRIPSTCDTKGKIYYACNNCTFTTTEELEIDPDNHALGEWQEVKAPTCAQDGEKIRYCTGKDCTYSEEGIIPATNEHTYADESELDFWWTVENITVGDTYKSWKIESIPTCFDAGSASTTCTACGAAETTADLPAHSYNFVEDESKRIPSTCVSNGSCHVVCSVCNANFTLSLPVDEANHIWKFRVTTEPTCTEDGLKTGYCSRHEGLTDVPTEVIPATGHSFKTYKSNNDATCEADGTKTAKCENCDVTDTVKDEGSKLECLKKWQFKDNNASCTTGGEAELICVYCDKVYDTEFFAAGVHPEIRKVTYAATCVKNGREDLVCSVCGVVSSKELPKTGHNEKRVNKTMPNCMTKTDRVDLLVCQTCGNITEDVIPYTHRLVNVSPAIDATCTTAGKTEHNKCLDCDYQELPETIAPIGHKDTDNDGCCNICYVYFVQNSQGQVVDCKCLCHNPDGIAKLFFKFYNFFCKLFGTNQVCDCGKLHYEKAGIN